MEGVFIESLRMESDFADFILPNVALNLYDFAQSPLGAVWEGGCYHYGNCHRQ